MKRVRIVLGRDLRHFERVDYDTDRVFSNTYAIDGLLVALARSLGHLNGRRLHAIEKINDSSKKCQCYKIDFQSVKDKNENGVRSCNCDNNARYRLVFNYGDKYYGVYLCKEHFVMALMRVKDVMVKRISDIMDNIIDYFLNVNLYSNDDKVGGG